MLRQKQRRIDQDLLKVEQLKFTIETLQRENKQLIMENQNYIDQLKEIKKKKRDQDIELNNVKETIRAVSDTQKRD